MIRLHGVVLEHLVYGVRIPCECYLYHFSVHSDMETIFFCFLDFMVDILSTVYIQFSFV